MNLKGPITSIREETKHGIQISYTDKTGITGFSDSCYEATFAVHPREICPLFMDATKQKLGWPEIVKPLLTLPGQEITVSKNDRGQVTAAYVGGELLFDRAA